MATDGLFDNMSLEQLKSIIDEDYNSHLDDDMFRLAYKIAHYAYRLSLDQEIISPLS